jgi:FkbM family methyltransferase
MKHTVKRLFRAAGYDVQRLNEPAPGSSRRPVGDYARFLEDVRARGLSPRLILDIGANKGDWTRMARGVFPEARFVLVEPQLEMRDALNALCRELPGVSWIEAGVGKEPGTLKQIVYVDNPGSSSFLPQTTADPRRSGTPREVRIVTIDAALNETGGGIPDLIKIDVQGFEIEVLRGATSILGATELFVIEVSLFPFMVGMPVLRDVVTFMGDHGYELYDFPGYFRRPLDGALGQVDVAFAKRHGVLRQSSEWR